MNKITNFLWFDKEAGEAAKFYLSVFPETKIFNESSMHDTPSGDVQIINMRIMDQEFSLMSAGPLFKINASVSFMVVCTSKEQVDGLWNKLVEGGKALMELASYPFSERYGWVMDKYGVTWQLIYPTQKVESNMMYPCIMFLKEHYGKVEEAIDFYVSVFKNARKGELTRYGEGMEPDTANAISHGEFILEGQRFCALESAHPHAFALNEAISFVVSVSTQEELDYYWNKLSAVPESEQCGWLKDKYGVSWQIVPKQLSELMSDPDPKKRERVTQTMLQMKRLDIAKLQSA